METVRDTVFEVGTKLWPLKPPTHTLLVVMKACFSLRNGVTARLSKVQYPCTEGRFHGDDPRQTVRYPSDFAFAKLRSELLLMGSCHAPSDVPVERVRAMLAVGTLRLEMEVVGDRHWEMKDDGFVLSPPEPFLSMPLRWERAFGGPSRDGNPVGRGLDRISEIAPIMLPNIEDPAALITQPQQRPNPFGAFPIPSDWQARRELLGTCDEEWRATRFPFLPQDFDHAYFNAAPESLQREGAFEGDEEILLRNLAAGHPEIRSKLPGSRPRAFVEWTEQRGAIFEEVPLRLDTIVLDCDDPRAICIWRGSVELPEESSDTSAVSRLFCMDEAGAEQAELEACRARMRRALERESSAKIDLSEEDERLGTDLASVTPEDIGEDLRRDSRFMDGSCEALFEPTELLEPWSSGEPERGDVVESELLKPTMKLPAPDLEQGRLPQTQRLIALDNVDPGPRVVPTRKLQILGVEVEAESRREDLEPTALTAPPLPPTQKLSILDDAPLREDVEPTEVGPPSFPTTAEDFAEPTDISEGPIFDEPRADLEPPVRARDEEHETGPRPSSRAVPGTKGPRQSRPQTPVADVDQPRSVKEVAGFLDIDELARAMEAGDSAPPVELDPLGSSAESAAEVPSVSREALACREEAAPVSEETAEAVPSPSRPLPSGFVVKNTTPFPHGTKLTSTRPPQPEMVIVVRGRFDMVHEETMRVPEGLDALEQGPLSGDVFADPDGKGELLYPSDFADIKLNTDIMVRGTCHTPGKAPLPRCPVSIEVGTWRKALWVVGSRVWREGLLGARASDPQPFSEMPIGYSRSFGGPGFAPNPAGLGLDGIELPNIESAEEPIRTPRDRPSPAGLGPLNPWWPLRAGKVGKKYGESYRKQRAPYYAEDFDWTYFNAAPPDQQLAGFLEGNETIRLQNLNPEHPVLATRLPGLRIRCFVNDETGHFREVRMHLDTVLVETDASQVLLTWRGRTNVRDTEFAEVTSVLIDSEQLDEPRAEPEAYRRQLEEFEASFHEPLVVLPPEIAALEKAKAEGDGKAAAAAVKALIEQQNPGALAELEELASREGVDIDAAIMESVQKKVDLPPPVPIPAAPRIWLGVDREALEQQIEQLREHDAEQAQELEERLNDPQLSALDPNYRPPGWTPSSTDPPGPGADLSGRDFSGQDLAGEDLRGANLEGAVFMNADLSEANLSGARLDGVMLFKADLTGANLEGADLSRINAARARLDDANLAGANIEQAYFGHASLRGARLDGARGSSVFFNEADLTGASLKEVELVLAELEQALLEDADFEGARLVACKLTKCSAARLGMARTLLSNCSFEDSDLHEADFEQADGPGTNWTRANLEGADLSYSRFLSSFFVETRAARCSFSCANLQESRFFKAELDHACFDQAKLLSADLCKASLEGASFVGACLFAAKLVDAYGDCCDFTDANLERCRVPE